MHGHDTAPYLTLMHMQYNTVPSAAGGCAFNNILLVMVLISTAQPALQTGLQCLETGTDAL